MINIILPVAGEGSSFKDNGGVFPKNLTEINRKPMIQWVVESLRISQPHRFIFVVNKQDHEEFSISYTLNLLANGASIVVTSGQTGGSLCSALMAIDFIKDEDPCVIVNGDQVIRNQHFDKAITYFQAQQADGGIITFDSVHPKWSYVKLDSEEQVIEVAEKRPISRNATAGVYYFKNGEMFINSAFQIIRKDVKTLDQFFVCPVYNELILDNKKVIHYPIKTEEMISLGTPEEVVEFTKTLREE